MRTSDFVPKTQILQRMNRTVPGYWPIGVDWGYSGIKGLSPNKAFILPNCAIKAENAAEVSDPDPTDIVVRDEDGTWFVGDLALSLMGTDGGMNYEMEMYGRNRYFSPVFKTLMKVGIGFALSRNQIGCWDPAREKVVLQTGLPPRYRKADSPDFKEALSGKYDFEMRVGNGPFMRYRFEIDPEGVFIMEQARGALASSVMDAAGNVVPSQAKLMKQRTLCIDPGFKTLDVFNIASGVPIGEPQTFDNLGMQEVYLRAAAEIMNRYGKEMSVPAMQVAAKNGYFTSFNRRQMTTEKIWFGEILERANMSVCSDAVAKILTNWDYLQNHDNLIITGGAGDAWAPIIKERLRGMENLSIISSNRNDPSLSNVFGNVRGYYFRLVNRLSRKGASVR